MDIKSILELEKIYPNRINLVLSGSFVKVYNRSFYLLNEVLGKKLKPTRRYIKRADNQFVVSGGFPALRIEVYYPNAKKTEWGYQIVGNYNTEGYDSWRLRQESAAQAVGSGVTPVAGSLAHLCAGEAATQNFSGIGQEITNLLLPLTQQQTDYLQNWQKGDYPIEVDLGFIESLKQQLAKSDKK